LTTLRSRHVAVEGTAVRFTFKGKSGKEWKLKLQDRRLAKIIRGVQELPGQHLFQYLDETGERRQVTSQDVNDYIREAAGSEMSSKHFRTWGGTVRAAILLCDTPLPTSKSDLAKAMNAVIDEVAQHLGNTRKVCRDCYIHPEIIASWQEGTLQGEMATLRKSSRKTKGLDRDEVIVLRWLEARHLANQT
jgi:DNA topoisomerase-1